MINIFFVTLNYLGVGTYCRELIEFLKGQPNLNLYQLFLESEQYSEYTEIINDNIMNIYIPAVPKTKKVNIKKYSARCLDLLHKNISDKQKIIFHLNNSIHAQLGLDAKSRFHAKIVYTLHFLPKYYTGLCIDKAFTEELIPPKNEIERRLIRQSDQIICVTHFAKKTLMDHFSVPEKKVTVVHNGIGKILREYNLNKTQKDIIKRELGFSITEKIILFVGQLDQRKGIGFLLKAFSEISMRHPNTRLVVVGDGDFKEVLRHIEGHWGKITFTGNISSKEVAKFYQIACIGVIPSVYEQCSYVALEMMKYGLPIIASKVPGLQELFFENRNALFVSLCKFKSNDKAEVGMNRGELEEKLFTLLKNFRLRRQLGLGAKKCWESNFQRENMGRITLKLYYNLIEDSGGLKESKNQVSTKV